MSSTDSKITTLDDEQAPAPVVAPVVKAKKSAPAPVVAEAAADGDAAPDDAAPAAEAMYMVTVHATDGDAGNEAVDLCVNGYLYQLPRGVPCRVPERVLEGLRNAVTTKHKVVGDSVIEQNIPRFPFSAVPA